MQREELSLQREELGKTREELKSQGDVLKEQVAVAQITARLNAAAVRLAHYEKELLAQESVTPTDPDGIRSAAIVKEYLTQQRNEVLAEIGTLRRSVNVTLNAGHVDIRASADASAEGDVIRPEDNYE